MKSVQQLAAAVVLLCVLAGGNVLAANSTNSWNNIGGGLFTNDVNWDTTTAPSTTTDWTYFTNSQVSAYTVTFDKSVTTGPLNIIDDSVTFDMGGWRWDTPAGDSSIGTNGGAAGTVTFTSSSATNVSNGNVIVLGAASAGAVPSLGNNQTLVVDDSLGFPVRVEWAGGLRGISGPIVVTGTNAEFRIMSPNSFSGIPYGGVVVSNQAIFSFRDFNQPHGFFGPAAVFDNGILNNEGVGNTTYIGWNYTSGSVILSNNSTWTDLTDIRVGTVANNTGRVIMDNSTFVGQNLQLGDVSATPPGLLEIRNGSSATFSNRLVVTGWASHTNSLILNNGTISLGGGATAGVLTNQSVMRAAGTIRGIGNSPALVHIGSGQAGAMSYLDIGSSIGTLTLSNANLEIAAGTETRLEFSDTGLDQILITGGGATLLGSNVFTLVSGSAPLGPYKWGLGAYDFIVGTGVTYSAQYDNLTNILGAAGLVQNLDYRYGIFNIGGGLQALRLEFVPEPSTVLLLVGGGLVLWRFRRRKA
ncbi:PEP-CTERM sorting domain-containing protein [bacterium]|nr:PEP-CTERM sorting domain-containing protein [bacterium]